MYKKAFLIVKILGKILTVKVCNNQECKVYKCTEKQIKTTMIKLVDNDTGR